MMNGLGLQRRVAELEWRVTRVEAAIGLAPAVGEAPAVPLADDAAADAVAASESAAVVEAAGVAPVPVTDEPVVAPVAAARADVVPGNEAGPAEPPSRFEGGVAEPSAPQEVGLVPPPLPARAAQASSAERGVLAYEPAADAPPAALREGAWEQTIGLKWAGWVGAVVLIVGAALGVKYGYDVWFSKTPPAVRVGSMGLLGLALLAAGEWVYRRVHVWAAVGLFGAGVATMFLCAYVGHGVFDLYPRDRAFALMALATVVGAGVSIRGRLVSIAVLSLIGGNLAPLILGGDSGRVVTFMAYVLMLQVVALVLAWWGRDRRWWTVRWLSLATTGLWTAGVLLGPAGAWEVSAAPLMFAVAYAVLFQSELVASALHRGEQPDETWAPSGVFSTAVTGLLLAGTLVALEGASPTARGAWVLAYGGAALAAGWALRTVAWARVLSLALRMQAAALVVVAVPVALSGSAVVLAWAALAVGFGVMAWRMNLPIARVAAVVTWALAVWYVRWALDQAGLRPALTATGVTLMGQAVPVYATLIAAVVAAGHAVAWLIGTVRLSERRDDGPAEVMAVGWWRRAWIVSAAATVVWVVTAMAALEPVAATVAMLAYAWALVLVDWAGDRLGAGDGEAREGSRLVMLRLAVQALVVVTIATGKWVIVDLLAQRLGQGWTAAQLGYAPVANPLMAVGGAVAVSLIGIWLLRRQRLDAVARALTPRGESAAIALAGGLAVFVTLALSLEVDRVIESTIAGGWASAWRPGQVRQLCWTMLWAVAAVALGGVVWRLSGRDPQRRYDRLAILAAVPVVLVAKYCVFDTLAWRIASGVPAAPPIGNVEALAAAVVLGAVVAAWMGLRGPAGLQINRRREIVVLVVTGMLLMLYAGTLEVGRGIGGAGVALQVGYSIWWSAFALATIILGFVTRAAAMRYFGLGLFALTVAKVFFVDMQGVGTGWRTLSFIGLGLLLLGTSVVYGKYSPKLLAARKA